MSKEEKTTALTGYVNGGFFPDGMEQYNWMSHYGANMQQSDSAYPFQSYDIANETGSGRLISCTVFPGVQTVYNDLNMSHCGKTVPKNDDIIEISYCANGRYECEVSNQYCFYVSHGDLSIGTVGRRESGGSFPTNRYSGLTVFLDIAAFSEQNDFAIRDLKIDLDRILRAALQYPRRFILHECPEIDDIFRVAIDAQKNGEASILKLKILELLLFLGKTDVESLHDMPAYLNHAQAKLAKTVRQLLISDLSVHLTLEQLSGKLRISPTMIKKAFKTVYGESVRAYMKSYRLNEAQRLLRETRFSVAEVAAMVGFQNPGHFSAAFRKKYGILPGEYKNSVQFEQ